MLKALTRQQRRLSQRNWQNPAIKAFNICSWIRALLLKHCERAGFDDVRTQSTGPHALFSVIAQSATLALSPSLRHAHSGGRHGAHEVIPNGRRRFASQFVWPARLLCVSPDGYDGSSPSRRGPDRASRTSWVLAQATARGTK